MSGVGGETKTACLPRGTLTLTGKDSYGDGWNGANIKVVDADDTTHVYFEWSGPTSSDGTNELAIALHITPPQDQDTTPIADRVCASIRGPCAADEYESVAPIAGSTNRECTLITNWTPVCQAVVVIPDGVPSIPNNAFYECASLTSVTIPNSVTSIGDYAFRACGNLGPHIDIPDSVTSIGIYAFYRAVSLKTVSMPASLESVGSHIFALSGITQQIILTILPDPDATDGRPTGTRLSFIHAGACPLIPGAAWISTGNWGYEDTADSDAYNEQHHTVRGHYTIPQGVTDIENGAFRYCKLLTSVTIPNSVVRIGYRTFAWTGLTGEAPIPNSVTTIAGQAFKSTAITSVTIPNGVTKLPVNVFDGCASLHFVTIPNSVTEIGAYAFNLCTSLTSITIPDSVTSIGDWAFRLSGLTSVSIPDSITTIGQGIFYSTALTSVSIPDSVTSIGRSAFSNCASLASIIIPDSVTSIGDWAFSGCTSLTSVSIPDSVTTWGQKSFLACTSLATVYIGGNVPYIPDWTFSETALTSVVIPDSVTYIGAQAFYKCNALTSVYIPDSVTEIKVWAFGLTPITNINIPDSVTSIGDTSFAGADPSILCNKRCTADGQVAPVNTVSNQVGCMVAQQDTLVCADCPHGTYNDDDSIVCSDWAVCPAGEYVTQQASASENTGCEPCKYGTFSTTTNAASCLHHKKCAYKIEIEGTSTNDVKCYEQYCCKDGLNGPKTTFSKDNKTTSGFWGSQYAPHTPDMAEAFCRELHAANALLKISQFFYRGSCDAPKTPAHNYPPEKTLLLQGMQFPIVPARKDDGSYCHEGAECNVETKSCHFTKNSIKCGWHRNQCVTVDVCGNEPVCWEIYNKWRDYNVNEWDCLNKDNCAGTFREHDVCCEDFTHTCYACKMCLSVDDYCMLSVNVREEPGLGVPPGCYCPSGSYSIAGDTFSPCNKCQAGWGNGAGGNTPCSPCPAGTANPIEAGVCEVCPYPKMSAAGALECVDATVLTCAEGQKWTPPTTTVDGSCAHCPAGTHGPEADANGETAQTYCTTCPHGSYSETQGLIECTVCPDDQTTTTGYPGVGSTLASDCTDCAADEDCRVRTTENDYTCRRERELAGACETTRSVIDQGVAFVAAEDGGREVDIDKCEADASTWNLNYCSVAEGGREANPVSCTAPASTWNNGFCKLLEFTTAGECEADGLNTWNTHFGVCSDDRDIAPCTESSDGVWQPDYCTAAAIDAYEVMDEKGYCNDGFNVDAFAGYNIGHNEHSYYSGRWGGDAGLSLEDCFDVCLQGGQFDYFIHHSHTSAIGAGNCYCGDTKERDECDEWLSAHYYSYRIQRASDTAKLGYTTRTACETQGTWEDAYCTNSDYTTWQACETKGRWTGNEENLGCRSTTAPKDDTGKN